MVQRMRVVSVSIEYVDHEHGLWCTRCALSTGLRLWLAVAHAGRMHLQSRLYCYECESGKHVVDA